MEHERNLKFAVAKGVVGLALGTIVLATQSLASPLQEQSDRVIVALDPTAPLANRSGHAAAISPDGRYVLRTYGRWLDKHRKLFSSGNAALWDRDTGRKLHTFEVPDRNRVECVAYSPCGRYVAVGNMILPVPSEYWPKP